MSTLKTIDDLTDDLTFDIDPITSTSTASPLTITFTVPPSSLTGQAFIAFVEFSIADMLSASTL